MDPCLVRKWSRREEKRHEALHNWYQSSFGSGADEELTFVSLIFKLAAKSVVTTAAQGNDMSHSQKSANPLWPCLVGYQIITCFPFPLLYIHAIFRLFFSSLPVSTFRAMLYCGFSLYIFIFQFLVSLPQSHSWGIYLINRFSIDTGTGPKVNSVIPVCDVDSSSYIRGNVFAYM